MQSLIHLQLNREMTGYKFMKRTRMCSERTDIAISIGRSPLCGWSLIICYMFFLTLMHTLEVITSFRYPNIIWGKNYYIGIPYLPRGKKWLYSHFSGGDLLYSHFPAYPGKGYIWLYSHFFRGQKWLWVNNGYLTPARIMIIRFADI